MLARQLAVATDMALAPLRDALGRAAGQRQAQAAFDTPHPSRLLLGIDQAERLTVQREGLSDTADLLSTCMHDHGHGGARVGERAGGHDCCRDHDL
jgi:hypothetical protein